MDPFSFFLAMAARSSLVLLLIVTLLFVWRNASSAERHFVLLLGLITLLLMPAELLFCPRFRCKIPVSAPTILFANPTGDTVEATVPSAASSFSPASARESSPLSVLTNPAWIMVLVMGAGMVVQIVLLTRAAAKWRRIRLTSRRVSLPPAVLARAYAFAGTKKIPPIHIAEELSVPVLIGTWRPLILLPESTVRETEQRLSMVLCHELAHFRRGDLCWLPLFALLRLLYWWHPLFWLTLARLRRERERACDDLVLAHRFSSSDYAELIISAARLLRSVEPALFGSMAIASSSSLGDRILAILDPGRRRRQIHASGKIVGCLFALLFGSAVTIVEIRAEETPDYSGEQLVLVTSHYLEINQTTYQAHRAEVEKALESGDVTWFAKLPDCSLLSDPAALVRSGQEATCEVLPRPESFKKDREVDSNILAQILKAHCGVTTNIIPFILPDRTIELRLRANISVYEGKSADHAFIDSRSIRTTLRLGSGQSKGFLLMRTGVSAGQLAHPPPIQSAQNLSFRDKVTFVIFTARLQSAAQTHNSSYLPDVSGVSSLAFPAFNVGLSLVEIDESAYMRNADAMNKAVSQGSLDYFRNTSGVSILSGPIDTEPADVKSWASLGKVFGYVEESHQENAAGKWSTAKPLPTTVLTDRATFVGANLDFDVVPSVPKGIKATSSNVSVISGFEKIPGIVDTPSHPEFSLRPHFSNFVIHFPNNELFVGQTYGQWIGGIQDYDQLNFIKGGSGLYPFTRKSRTRLAVFVTVAKY